jgi:hypothetical protein
MVEHVFIAEILQEAWFVREQSIEVLRAEVDAFGYDLVLESNGIIRHVQLKASEVGSSTRKQTINRLLEGKPGGCVVWIWFARDDQDQRMNMNFLYYGGKRPRDRMPSLGSVLGRNPRSKSPRPNTRVLDRRQFDFILTTADLLERMFGRPKPLK